MKYFVSNVHGDNFVRVDRDDLRYTKERSEQVLEPLFRIYEFTQSQRDAAFVYIHTNEVYTGYTPAELSALQSLKAWLCARLLRDLMDEEAQSCYSYNHRPVLVMVNLNSGATAVWVHDDEYGC